MILISLVQILCFSTLYLIFLKILFTISILTRKAKSLLLVFLQKKENILSFKDTGPGIPEDKLELLFQDFMTSDKKEGTGLGLSFCRKVMESFGVSIKFSSVLKEYTEFTLNFPVRF
jgi:two-component system CAI-1 autoinducer sensor kinase/phosphatase CqsS